jgi:hypothetical protein
VKRRIRRPPTQILGAPLVREETEDKFLSERRAFGRKVGAKKRREDARLPDVVVDKIAEYCRGKPAAFNSDIARWLRRNRETKPLVAHLQFRSLAKKIGHARPPRQKVGTTSRDRANR